MIDFNTLQNHKRTKIYKIHKFSPVYQLKDRAF